MNSEINVLDLIGVFLKKWWIIAIITIILGTSSFAVTKYMMSPIYSSKGMIYVNNANSNNIVITQHNNVNYNDLVASQKLATTYIEILKSETFMSDISRETGLNISAAQMRSLISVTSKNETEILEISAMHTDPQVAVDIVENVLENSKSELTKVFKGGSVEIIDHALVPQFPSGPNVLKNTALGIILGIILGCLLVLILNLFDNTVKNQDDLISRYNVPVLGMIPSISSSKATYYGSVNLDGA